MSGKHPSSGDELAAESGLIELYVRELDQLFDSFDPSPFHEKGLDREAHEYIVSTAKELPGGGPTALVVYLAQPVGLPDEGRVLGDAIRTYFARRAELMRRELRARLRQGWINLMIGLALLVTSVVISERLARHGQGPLTSVLNQSLLIGGWVAMWRPMDFFLYELWMMRAELRLYERLSQAAVRIAYTGKGSLETKPKEGAFRDGGGTRWPTSKSSECSTTQTRSTAPART